VIIYILNIKNIKMNYEEKYKEMKKRVLAIGQGYVKEVDYNSPRSIAEYIDPELCESEDERIRKEIISFLKEGEPYYCPNSVRRQEWANWLEKQGSKVDVLDDFPTEFERQISHLIASSINKEWEYKKDFVKHTANSLLQYAKNELEKQAKQKLIDESKPKFNVGDWITNGEYTWKVTDIKPLDYILQSQNGDVVDDTISYVDEEFHLWTIQDAKDGDILATKKGNPFIYDKNRYNNGLAYYYAGLDVNKELTLKSPHHMLTHFGELNSVSPATKEQRDLLFQKMKESGYEWDAEKKELNKIEQKYDDSYCKENCKGFQENGKCFTDWDCKDKREAEQKSSWSENDEKMKNLIISTLTSVGTINLERYYHMNFDEVENWLKSLKNRVQPQPTSEWSDEDEEMYNEVLIDIIYTKNDLKTKGCLGLSKRAMKAFNWFSKRHKSLRPQSTWKPSDEQLTALKNVIVGKRGPLYELYFDLEKL
jgi:hypothetical protein